MTTLHLHNIKCHGCANTILSKLKSIEGVSAPEVSVEDGTISFDTADLSLVETVKNIMAKAGYPESDPTLAQTAKSFVSCMVGRVKS